ncbi:MAG: HAMP domain-containing histidine kinase [Gemmatimonadetes bacterium]|nr:HAMP domain-containing histidine kinase [Gemmatimonadota bacterium]
MTNSSPPPSLGSGRPGSRTAYVAALLVGTLALSAVLAYQVVDAHRSHQNVAKKTVGEQAGVAAWAYAGAARRMLLDKLMWPAVDVVGRAGGEFPDRALTWDTLSVLAAEKQWPHLDDMVFAFRVDLETEKGTFIGHGSHETVEWVKASAAGWAAHRSGGSQPTMVIPPSGSPGPVIYVTYPEAPEPARVLFGAALYESALEETLALAFESTALLPAALTGATPNDELFSCAVLNGANESLFRSGAPFEPEFVGTDTLGAQYAGLRTEVRVRPELARTLVIGGFPRSRLPLVFGLMALTGGLVFAAIFQLRREGELARLRADFVSGVSHELRTPLAQIRMFAETLALERVRSDEERTRSVDIIVNEAQRLSHQVDNVLLFSRSERGRMHLDRSRTDLSAILDEVLEAFAPLARAAGVQVVLESGGAIQADLDGDAIRQVLLNLLDNAVKYGPTGQTVTVGAARAPGGQAIVWVEDEGDGVPPDQAKEIFDPYSRLERHRESAVAGSGIGLAVAREIVRGHGGDIWVESAMGGGARFVVRLPCETQPQPASA